MKKKKDAPLFYIPLMEKKFLPFHSCKMPLTVVYILISEMLKCEKVYILKLMR